MKNYCTYILINKNNTLLYTGLMNNLTGRIWEYKSKLIEGFTNKYNVDKLVYSQSFENPNDAIKREKQLKAGSRKKKDGLSNKINSEWKDLYNFKIIYL